MCSICVTQARWGVRIETWSPCCNDNTIGAWVVGSLAGYTLDVPWTPRIGIQADAASGDRHPGDGRVETFNPLFPNGYYFSLAGYTDYANLIGAVEAVHFQVGDSIRNAGGSNADYVGVELKYGW